LIDVRFATGEIDLNASLRILAMLPGDPTLRLQPGRLERATHTPNGPGTISANWDQREATVEVHTDGPGAEWLADRAGAMLGLADDAEGFEPTEGVLRELWRRHRGLRIPRTGTLWHDLCWLVVQQRVRRPDAARQWRQLVQRYGSLAPGRTDLLLPPSPGRLAEVPYHELHRLGIERRRADTLRIAARSTIDLNGLVDRPVAEALRQLHTLCGVGPWTTSTLSAVTWGDPDAVIVGDSGIPSLVSWALARERSADDDRMLTLLEPFRPHRYRVIKLAFASGLRPPRHQPYARRHDIRRI